MDMDSNKLRFRTFMFVFQMRLLKILGQHSYLQLRLGFFVSLRACGRARMRHGSLGKE